MKKNFNRKALITGISLIILGIAIFLLTFMTINVDSQGVVHGPISLIAAGLVAILAGTGTLIVASFFALRKQDRAVQSTFKKQEENKDGDTN